MSEYKYIIFDLDGTLINPQIGQINSVAYALSYFKIYEKDNNKLSKFIGPPLKESFAKYYGFNNEQIDKGIEKYREYFLEKGIMEANVYEGIIPMLSKLKQNNKKIIIATSNPTSFAEKIANIYGLREYLYDICGSNLDGTRVLKSEIISYAIEKNKIKEKNNTVMVGDRSHDIIGAKEANIDSIGVLYGYGDHEELSKANATYIVGSVKELQKKLLNN